jgi:dienelactone hydrolase
MKPIAMVVAVGLWGVVLRGLAAAAESAPAPGDAALAAYFQAETTRLASRCLAEIHSAADWAQRRPIYRQQLLEMLGLWPMPPRGDLKPVITGRIEHPQFTVEKLHFQSLPGLYVTANLYLPKNLTQPAPAILYLCGHSVVVSNRISYGNKVAYQHHGIWFAQHGYVCLVVDSVQLGEIQGLHHGTYREGLWWWNARGYTPAGVEAWNCLRALDYLCTRPEVDTNRFGVTGRSGGGAYSWWTAAVDDRIKAAAPVAGITDLQNHVVDGTVEGHCDCMFMVNTYRWDYPQVAALVAPRPLLLVNTDADSIFPLDGVLRTHAHLRRLYGLLGASNLLGLVIAPGPHKDTQDLQVPVLRWFNRHLKGQDPILDQAALRLFAAHELKVFDQLPADAINTNIHASFVPAARIPAPPNSQAAWQQQRDAWRAALDQKVFAGWPEAPGPLDLQEKVSVSRHGLRLRIFEFTSQPHVRLRLYALARADLDTPKAVHLHVLGPGGPAEKTTDQPASPAGAALVPARLPFDRWLAIMQVGFQPELSQEQTTTPRPALAEAEAAQAFQQLQNQLQAERTVWLWVPPRGIGLTAWSGDTRKQTQIRRRFMLLGQTLDSMRVWDIRRAIQTVRAVPAWQSVPLHLQAQGHLAADALYAALFEPEPASLHLWALPISHHHGPDFLNVLRVLDLPQTVAMVAERCPVRLYQTPQAAWTFPSQVAANLGWAQDRLLISAP